MQEYLEILFQTDFGQIFLNVSLSPRARVKSDMPLSLILAISDSANLPREMQYVSPDWIRTTRKNEGTKVCKCERLNEENPDRGGGGLRIRQRNSSLSIQVETEGKDGSVDNDSRM